MIDSTLDPPNDSMTNDLSSNLIRVKAKAAIIVLLLAIALLGSACAKDSRPLPAPQPSEPAAGAQQATGASETTTNENAAPPDSETNAGGASEPGDKASNGEESGDEEEQEQEEKEERPQRAVLDTVYDDARVGADQTPLIEAELGLVDDEALNRYVRSVALRLLRYAPVRPFDYEFKIVDQSVPNAFALPGGKIYVSRGLLALTTSEDELAGVLGHEITHAADRHASARLEYSRRFNPFSIGFVRAAKIAAYGRDQERDADRGGQIMAARAGYDPNGIATFLRKLDASERYVVGWSRIPSFFATHPTSPERSALAINRASELEWQRTPGVSDKEPTGYYGIIDGLILGDDPAGGVFDDENRFTHPELRFSIRFPQGWETMNSQQAVRALAPKRDAQLELTATGLGDRELDEHVDEFIDSEFDGMTIRVRERRPLKIGELPAVRIEGPAKSPFGALNANITFVLYDGLVYRLTLLTIGDAASRYRGRIRAFAHSFRPLDEDGVHSLTVTRLRIARSLENETLQALSARTRNELEVVFTGVLNGIYASTPLGYRTPIKIGIVEPYLPRPVERPAEQDDDAPSGTETNQDGTEPRVETAPNDAMN